MATLRADVHLLEGTTSVAISRTHAVVIDRPPTSGGTDRGFLGGELLLAAQGGCFLSNLVAAARARDLDLERATVEVTGETADAPARFASVRVAVRLVTTATEAEQERLVAVASRACIVTNTLGRGTELEILLAPPDEAMEERAAG